MQIFAHRDFDGHEQVVFVRDAAAGLAAIVAVHHTGLGPALGGCRIWKYESEADAVADVLRLSRGMTYKAALAGLALGGGKSVVLADARADKTPEMMRAMGRAVDRLAGRYIIAEDVGATADDMDQIALETPYVSGASNGPGDPSPWTAEGVFLSMQAAAQKLWGADVSGRHVAVTGLGHVGSVLCEKLRAAGAKLSVADILPESVGRMVQATGAVPVEPHRAHAVDADIFAPCALGAVLNASAIPDIRARLVCGSANNQLAADQDGARLRARGILYAPDYLVNAGGLISAARGPLGMSDAEARAKLLSIPRTLLEIFEAAEKNDSPPGDIADRLAESRFRPTKT